MQPLMHSSMRFVMHFKYAEVLFMCIMSYLKDFARAYLHGINIQKSILKSFKESRYILKCMETLCASLTAHKKKVG